MIEYLLGKLWRWIKNIGISVDQFANAFAGPVLNVVFRVKGFGDPDETLSSVFGKYRHKCVLCRWICEGFLDRIDPGHCADAIEEDEGSDKI